MVKLGSRPIFHDPNLVGLNQPPGNFGSNFLVNQTSSIRMNLIELVNMSTCYQLLCLVGCIPWHVRWGCYTKECGEISTLQIRHLQILLALEKIQAWSHLIG
jgi:hypothetical protein